MITFGYWNSRGIAEPIRLLLGYLEVEYKEEHFNEMREWFDSAKKELKTNFPNLPYLIDGDFIVTESLVIPVYLIKKYKKFELLGQNPDGSYNQNEIVVQQLIQVMRELRTSVYVETKLPTFKEKREKLFAAAQITLDKIQKQLGDKQFLVGHFTYADIFLYDILRYLQFLNPNFNFLTEYMKRIENIPQIRKYLDTKENKVFILDSIKQLFYV